MEVPANGTTLFYQDDDFADAWREHDTVALQHGYCRNGNFWRGWVPPISREFRVLRMDMRGMGRSADPGPNYKYSLEGLAADFVAFLDAVGVPSMHYVGESLAGMVGVTAAARYPERFKSLTLVATPVTIEPNTSSSMATGFSSWGEAIEKLGMREHWLATRKVQNELSGDSAQDNYFADEFARTPAHVAVALSRAVPGATIAESARRVTAPTLLLVPGKSPHTNAGQQSELQQLIPHARLKSYDEAFHGIFYLRPDMLARDTLEFIRDVSKERVKERVKV